MASHTWSRWKVEATSGFEPLNRGFADLPLNHLGTSPRRSWPKGVRPDLRSTVGAIWVAAPRGFEPRLTDPKSAVLPLDEGAPIGAPVRAGRPDRPIEKQNGAEDGTRTRDPHLGKVMLYQLSHFRSCTGPTVWCREPGSNWRHRDFQSRALPTELSRPDGLDQAGRPPASRRIPRAPNRVQPSGWLGGRAGGETPAADRRSSPGSSGPVRIVRVAGMVSVCRPGPRRCPGLVVPDLHSSRSSWLPCQAEPPGAQDPAHSASDALCAGSRTDSTSWTSNWSRSCVTQTGVGRPGRDEARGAARARPDGGQSRRGRRNAGDG